MTQRNPVSIAENVGPMNYLLEWGHPIVLKDPRLLFTLPHWVIAARRLGRVLGVIFCYRPNDELIAAWEVAPYTRDLLMHDKFQTYLALLREQQAWIYRAGVSYLVLSLQELRQIDAAYDVTGVEMSTTSGALCDRE
ncbi:MAG: hypothetical protein HY527_07785 [Betaproteobacteria bacterium]|nr:hypothetical protein [Betaproteobacteria bacterium]